MTEAPPIISGYSAHQHLGSGPLGAVWAADRLGSQTPFVIKSLHPSIAGVPTVVERLRAARGPLLTLTHPNIVQIHDVLSDTGMVTIISERVNGNDLRRSLDTSGPAAPGMAVEIVRQVLLALAEIHQRGFAHGDLKLTNVLVETGPDGRPRARVTDTAIAACVAGTVPGIPITTPSRAPEVPAGATGGAPADVYAAGAILHELLTGASAVPGFRPRPGIPAPVAGLLVGMLSVEPLRRPRAREAAAAMQAFLPGLAAAPSSSVADGPTTVLAPAGSGSTDPGAGSDPTWVAASLSESRPAASAPSPGGPGYQPTISLSAPVDGGPGGRGGRGGRGGPPVHGGPARFPGQGSPLGAGFPGAALPGPAVAFGAPEPPKRRNGLIFWGTMVAVVVVGAIVIWALGRGDDSSAEGPNGDVPTDVSTDGSEAGDTTEPDGTGTGATTAQGETTVPVPVVESTVPVSVPETAPAPKPTAVGYWIVSAQGAVLAKGDSPPANTRATPDVPRVVAAQATPSGNGLWLLQADGTVRAFGDAGVDTLPDAAAGKSFVGLSPTPTGAGYFVATSDGSVFGIGDANAAIVPSPPPLASPIVGVVATASGQGIWLVAQDGSVYAYGDAPFVGSLPGQNITATVVAVARTPTAGGYLVVGADGGVFGFGDAGYFGSIPELGVTLTSPIVGVAGTPSGQGYWLLGADGGVFSFGDAEQSFHGSAVGELGFGDSAAALVPRVLVR